MESGAKEAEATRGTDLGDDPSAFFSGARYDACHLDKRGIFASDAKKIYGRKAKKSLVWICVLKQVLDLRFRGSTVPYKGSYTCSGGTVDIIQIKIYDICVVLYRTIIPVPYGTGSAISTVVLL